MCSHVRDIREVCFIVTSIFPYCVTTCCSVQFSYAHQGNTVGAIGYKMELGTLTMRGRINSLGVVAATVEKRLDPIPGVLVASGRINHWTDEAKFGLALLIG